MQNSPLFVIDQNMSPKRLFTPDGFPIWNTSGMLVESGNPHGRLPYAIAVGLSSNQNWSYPGDSTHEFGKDVLPNTPIKLMAEDIFPGESSAIVSIPNPQFANAVPTNADGTIYERVETFSAEYHWWPGSDAQEGSMMVRYLDATIKDSGLIFFPNVRDADIVLPAKMEIFADWGSPRGYNNSYSSLATFQYWMGHAPGFGNYFGISRQDVWDLANNAMVGLTRSAYPDGSLYTGLEADPSLSGVTISIPKSTNKVSLRVDLIASAGTLSGEILRGKAVGIPVKASDRDSSAWLAMSLFDELTRQAYENRLDPMGDGTYRQRFNVSVTTTIRCGEAYPKDSA